MSTKSVELDDWSFTANETSAGVYTAIGRDKAGRRVEMTGTDPDVLIARCKEAALQMMRESAGERC